MLDFKPGDLFIHKMSNAIGYALSDDLSDESSYDGLCEYLNMQDHWPNLQCLNAGDYHGTEFTTFPECLIPVYNAKI